MEMEDAVASGFLRPGDVLVMDNAANHTGKENTVLEDWLWNDHYIFALFLPARTPEWNPIELLWICLSMRSKHNDWDNIHGLLGLYNILDRYSRYLRTSTYVRK